VVAHGRGLGYQTLIRQWVLEQLSVAERQAEEVTPRFTSQAVGSPEPVSGEFEFLPDGSPWDYMAQAVTGMTETLSQLRRDISAVFQATYQVGLSLASATGDSMPSAVQAES
jgi:hypothetical protein